MKKIVLLLIFLLSSVSICSCQIKSAYGDSDKISELENRLSSLESENESNKGILDKLLSSNTSNSDTEVPSSATESSTQQSTENETKKGFTYSLSNGCAIITGYVGDDRSLVIPASIDGYKIVSIEDNAFEDSLLENVIISDGIRSIGWFSFNGCVKLKSITIPASVTSIGYSALGSSESSVNIFCHSGSFALEYAQSFGIPYTVI